ncbi:unnamed protein product [Thelazia callipaeda]|uniref:FZ domain-containing protein n=1 Tax=Thelazia callipaeda TaxID=103827 RepID=A0A0N5CT86_THECL|nr:unnamed protein product [Thelazia callipaeda]
MSLRINATNQPFWFYLPPNILPLLLSLLSVLLSSHEIEASIFEQASRSRCEPIEIPLCKDIPYNYTFSANSLLQPDQQSVSLTFVVIIQDRYLQTHTEHFKPLIKTKCNPHIKFFICSVFAPMCPEHMPQAVTSCRSVCEKVCSNSLT